MTREALLTIDEVAERCRVSSRTVRRWIGAGDLPAHRLGRQLRIAPNDLSAFLYRAQSDVRGEQ